MRLELLSPPALIAVADGATVHPALLLAVRGERFYVQVSQGPGANCLRWVDAAQVRPGADDATAAADPAEGAHRPTRGLPWVRPRDCR